MNSQLPSPGTSESDVPILSGEVDRPKTLEELFEFYYQRFKPLYSLVASHNVVPTALLLEAMAAFDHLSRHWKYQEQLELTIDRTAGHLKRGTFDAYKLVLKETRTGYERLCRTDTSSIDNGKFDQEYLELWARIRTGAAHARACEGNTTEDWHRAFTIWDQVFVDCEAFTEKYANSSKVNWARRCWWRTQLIQCLLTFVFGVVASLIAGVLLGCWSSKGP